MWQILENFCLWLTITSALGFVYIAVCAILEWIKEERDK